MRPGDERLDMVWIAPDGDLLKRALEALLAMKQVKADHLHLKNERDI
jgi:hypothetical protein